MLPNKEGYVRVRSNIAGEVEIKATVNQLFYSGQALAVVEGDREIESLSVRKVSRVIEIFVENFPGKTVGNHLDYCPTHEPPRLPPACAERRMGQQLELTLCWPGGWRLHCGVGPTNYSCFVAANSSCSSTQRSSNA